MIANILNDMKKQWQRLGLRLTRPPRLESSTKNTRINPIKKKKMNERSKFSDEVRPREKVVKRKAKDLEEARQKQEGY